MNNTNIHALLCPFLSNVLYFRCSTASSASKRTSQRISLSYKTCCIYFSTSLTGNTPTMPTTTAEVWLTQSPHSVSHSHQAHCTRYMQRQLVEGHMRLADRSTRTCSQAETINSPPYICKIQPASSSIEIVALWFWRPPLGDKAQTSVTSLLREGMPDRIASDVSCGNIWLSAGETENCNASCGSVGLWPSLIGALNETSKNSGYYTYNLLQNWNSLYFPYPLSLVWRSWLRHYATNRQVASSIPDGVSGIFHWHNPVGRTVALGSTQPLTEMSTKNISWG
jgi:hypothetical protein